MPPINLLGEGLLFGLTVGVMVLGLFGIVLPLLPGLELMWLAVLVYAALDGFHTLDLLTFAALTVLALAGLGAEWVVSHYGARATGASTGAGIAAILGGIVGLIVFSLPGALLGAALAVFLVEFRRHRNWRLALRSSGGWLAGWTAGRGMQLVLGVLMIVIFVARVLLSR